MLSNWNVLHSSFLEFITIIPNHFPQKAILPLLLQKGFFFLLLQHYACMFLQHYHTCTCTKSIYKSIFHPFPNKPWLLRVCSTSLLKTVGKEEIARNEQFLLFPQHFLPFWRTFCHFHQIKNCRLQTLSIWKSTKSVV